MSDTNGPPRRLPWRTLVKLLRPSTRRSLRGFYDMIERDELDASRSEFTPEGVLAMNQRAKALLEAAMDLACDDEWSDDAAVAELHRIAGRHREDLRVAEVNSRHGGEFLDLEEDNRAQRLLEAAVTGHPVKPVTAEDQHRFAVVGAFADLPPDEAWDELVRLVPGLDQLAGEVQAGSPPRGQSDKLTHRWTEQGLAALNVRVGSLVGPRSGGSDVLLSSVYARTYAMNHILLLSPHPHAE